LLVATSSLVTFFTSSNTLSFFYSLSFLLVEGISKQSSRAQAVTPMHFLKISFPFSLPLLPSLFSTLLFSFLPMFFISFYFSLFSHEKHWQ
jgi:hypothetical protein